MGPPLGNKSAGGGSRVTTFKIFLSGLPEGFKNSDLEPMFEQFGRTIECEVFRNNYAFVHMEEEECGREAIKALHDKEIDGKTISIVESKNTEGPNIQKMKLSVKNIPTTVNASELRSLFKKYGRILEAEVLPNGNGSVSLEATGDIRTAINEMNGYLIGTQQLIVEAVKVNPKQAANQAALGGGGSGPYPPAGEVGVGRGMRGGRGGPRGRGGFGNSRGPAPGYGGPGYGGYYSEDYYPPPVARRPDYPLGEREYYEPGQRPLLRPPQRRSMYQHDYYGEEDYYGGGPGPGGRPPQFGRNQQQFGGYEEDQSYSYDDYYNVQPEMQEYSQINNDRFGQPPRKLAKGEPYPPPPLPTFRAPNQARAGMYAAQNQFAAGPGGEPRPKSRGERGGRNRLTAGKVALLEAMKSAGINVPQGHIPSLLDVRATFGPRGGPGPRPRFPVGPGGPQMQSPNMMPVRPVASRFGGPRGRQTTAGAVRNLQQMALGNMSTSYPLPLFPSAPGANNNAQKANQGHGGAGYYDNSTASADKVAQQDYYSGYSENTGAPEPPNPAQRNPDIDFTADIMLF